MEEAVACVAREAVRGAGALEIGLLDHLD